MVVFFAGLFAILYRYTIDESAGALALTYALSLTSTLNWLVFFFKKKRKKKNIIF